MFCEKIFFFFLLNSDLTKRFFERGVFVGFFLRSTINYSLTWAVKLRDWSVVFLLTREVFLRYTANAWEPFALGWILRLGLFFLGLKTGRYVRCRSISPALMSYKRFQSLFIIRDVNCVSSSWGAPIFIFSFFLVFLTKPVGNTGLRQMKKMNVIVLFSTEWVFLTNFVCNSDFFKVSHIPHSIFVRLIGWLIDGAIDGLMDESIDWLIVWIKLKSLCCWWTPFLVGKNDVYRTRFYCCFLWLLFL